MDDYGADNVTTGEKVLSSVDSDTGKLTFSKH